MRLAIGELFGILVITVATALPVRADILIGAAGPMTGSMAWFGEQMQRGLDMKVAELNATGGALGQRLELLIVDDYCDPEQAIAAAKRLVEARVAAVIGHLCSGASIAASKIYAEAGILMISPYSSNPMLTEQGFANVFRVCGRDTIQATMVSDHLAERWRDEDIAIVHDGQAYGKGIAEEALRRLRQHGVSDVLFEAIEPGHADYLPLIDRLQAEGIDALYFAGYTPEAGVIVRQARSRDYDLEVIGSDALISEYFWRVAGPAAVGVKFVSYADPRSNEQAAPVVERFRADGYEPEGLTLYSYAGVEVWAQAVGKAGTREPNAVAATLRAHQFDTILGTIGFDAKGDVYGYEPFVWYVWQEGSYAPVEPSKLTE
jgi:branched-chain amino acid transport system substrate-binding protein